MVELTRLRQLHALGQRAIGEATARRAGSVEAEHLLLAILADTSSPASIALEGAGLTYPALAGALDSERSRSLAVAGIAPPSGATLDATARTTVPGWGASIRDVLRSADKSAAKESRPEALEIELVLTILNANIGTVPRALAIVPIDRSHAIANLASA
jgi:ATP-dependent Clp protease ATP-binding subunit ClpA